MHRNTVETIKEKLSIESVVGSYVKLEPKGKYFSGRCPFHNEKTPSFTVTPDKGIFYCYGCHKGGDIFTFIQEIEKISFAEALKHLADKAGVSLDMQDLGKSGEKSELKAIMDDATKYYEIGLRTYEPAVNYLLDRGMTKQTMVSFRIGYAKKGWSGLYDFLKKKNYSDEMILATGLCIQGKGNGLYDRFRERIMFPIADGQGTIVAFTGRVLPGTEESQRPVGKYINSPETALYHKSKVLFAYDRAKTSIHQQGFAVIVEGQMDCVMSHQAGITNVVAISGTAATDDHMIQLKRFTQNIALCLDSDRAGLTAALKTAMVAYRHDMRVAVLDMGTHKDPADVIREDVELWKKIVASRKDIITFRLEMMDTHHEHALKQTIAHQELFPLLKHSTSPIVVDEKLQLIAHHFKVTPDAIRAEYQQFLTKHSDVTDPVLQNNDQTYGVKNISQQEYTTEHMCSMLEQLLAQSNGEQKSDSPAYAIYQLQLERELGSLESHREKYERLLVKLRTKKELEILEQEKKRLEAIIRNHSEDHESLRLFHDLLRRRDELVRYYNQLP